MKIGKLIKRGLGAIARRLGRGQDDTAEQPDQSSSRSPKLSRKRPTISPAKRASAVMERAAGLRELYRQRDEATDTYTRDLRENEIASASPYATGRNRRDLLFKSQLRTEARGGESAMFGGKAASGYYEKIFYIATQDLWTGRSDRDEAIKEALGVETLEEAMAIVLMQNRDAIRAARDAEGVDAEVLEAGGSDPILQFINFVSAVTNER